MKAKFAHHTQTNARVMSVITRLNVGGPARHAILLNKGLEQQGFRPELVSGMESALEGTLLPDAGRHTRVPTLQRAVNPLHDLRTSRTLTALMRERRPAIVHTHLAKAGALARVAARQAKVPIVIHTFHGHVLQDYFNTPTTRLFTTIESSLARITDAFIAVSPEIRDELLHIGIGRPDQWHVISLALDLKLLERMGSSREARKRLGLTPTGPLIGTVTRLVPIKDHRTFLDAAALVARRRPDVTFVIAGDGELRTSLELRARELLGNRIRFLGWVTDLRTLYSALDIVVLTSRNEGTPAALIEAGAAGLPVVATRVGGVPDVVLDKVTGFLVPSGDSGGIATRLLNLLDDAEKASRMGRAGREFVHERFSGQRLVRDIAALYSDLLGRRPNKL
jgi:glycosyltransferase involved in cell wall biosynthesis